MITYTSPLEVLFGFSLLTFVVGTPGYGSYDYDGYGHNGYNTIGSGKKVVDYYSKPQYAFGYEVDDYYSQLSHGRWEVRDGDVTQGQYRVLLPDGRIQIVSYIADKGGYRPTIQYIGKGVHPPPPPPYAHIKPSKYITDPYLQLPITAKEVYPIATPSAPIFPSPHPPAFYGSGPLKLDLNPLAINSIPIGRKIHSGHRYGHSGYGNGPEDFLAFSPSSKSEVKLSPSKLSKRRALLYDKTLFRRDIPKPVTTPR